MKNKNGCGKLENDILIIKMEYIFLNDIFDKFQFKTESKVIIAASHIHLHEAVKLSQLNSQINIAAQNF